MSVYKFESDTLLDIVEHVDSNTLFIFDIDHTLIEPVQIIGSTHWERHLAKKLKEQGFTHHEACIRAFHQWRTIQHLTAVKAVEESVYEILTLVKNLNVQTLGLTARDGTLSELTFDQLKSVQLDKLFTHKEDCKDLPGNYPCKYTKGAIFCGFNKKDVGLQLFLEHVKMNPKKVVFVDDQKSHIDELEDLSNLLGIEYVGMTYHASGDHKFDPQIAEIQEQYLPKLISDKEALDLLEA
ncbi:MAG: hypothetical protein S4CHLAM6_13210 [Chlamydiae bacterium]|nr:hypothetical protein [Chlamydiota bacterium]